MVLLPDHWAFFIYLGHAISQNPQLKKMSRFPAGRYDEQRLIQEVLYLHSLWHQGPPTPRPTTLIPTPPSLQPFSSTHFKKRGKKKEKRFDSGIEWPCPEPPAVTDSGWPPLPLISNPKPQLLTPEELAHFAANQVHQQALKSVSKYFKNSNNAADDHDEDDDDESQSDDEDAPMEAQEGSKYDNFFVKLFAEDSALREYYENNREGGGEFSCLVCCGKGKKGWKKRFNDCVALVQHSRTITNSSLPHRAYARVICGILGWDINRLPSIVLSAGDIQLKDQGNENDGIKHGLSGASNITDAVTEESQQKEPLGSERQPENDTSSAPLEGNEDDGVKHGLNGVSNIIDAVNIRSDEVSQQKESSSIDKQAVNGGGSAPVEQDSSNEASASRSLEDVSEGVKEKAEGVSDSLEPLQDDKIVGIQENNC